MDKVRVVLRFHSGGTSRSSSGKSSGGMCCIRNTNLDFCLEPKIKKFEAKQDWKREEKPTLCQRKQMHCVLKSKRSRNRVATSDRIEVFKKKKHCYVTSAALSPSHRLYEPRGISTLGTVVGMGSASGTERQRIVGAEGIVYPRQQLIYSPRLD